MKYKCIMLSLVILIFLHIARGSVYAQETLCIDYAKTNAEVDKCGNQLVPPREDKVNGTFEGLSRKFKEKDVVQTMIRLSRQSWNNYRNIQCNLEEAITARGQYDGELPLAAKKAFQRCVIRTLDEMQSALDKLEDHTEDAGGRYQIEQLEDPQKIQGR